MHITVPSVSSTTSPTWLVSVDAGAASSTVDRVREVFNFLGLDENAPPEELLCRVWNVSPNKVRKRLKKAAKKVDRGKAPHKVMSKFFRWVAEHGIREDAFVA